MSLSERERITLLMMRGWGDNVRPFAEVTHLFNATFPDRAPISKSTAQYTVTRFVDTGSVKDRARSVRLSSVTYEDGSLDILQSFIENPNESVRSAAQSHGIGHESVRKLLKKSGFKAYRVTLLQKLSEDDFDRQMEFSEIMMNQIDQNQILLDGPFFIDGNLNANKYHDTLQHEIVPALQATLGADFQTCFSNKTEHRHTIEFGISNYDLNELRHRISHEAQAIPREYIQNAVAGFYNRLAHCQTTDDNSVLKEEFSLSRVKLSIAKNLKDKPLTSVELKDQCGTNLENLTTPLEECKRHHCREECSGINNNVRPGQSWKVGPVVHKCRRGLTVPPCGNVTSATLVKIMRGPTVIQPYTVETAEEVSEHILVFNVTQ
ncbi:hypothetical protein J6590_077049 [Homalodisca vitripennis]|nr:hypothetical protein J6590_077049 [Homalodisca vitripennis]